MSATTAQQTSGSQPSVNEFIIDTDTHNFPRPPDVLPVHVRRSGAPTLRRFGLRTVGEHEDPARAADGGRGDAWSTCGRPPGNDPEFFLEQLLDRYGMDAAILNNSRHVLQRHGRRQPALRLHRRPVHGRPTTGRAPSGLAGTTASTPRSPCRARTRRRRRGDRAPGRRPRFVQLRARSDGEPMGNRSTGRCYEAAARTTCRSRCTRRHGATRSPGGLADVLLRGPRRPRRRPRRRSPSLICEGVFDRLPTLRSCSRRSAGVGRPVPLAPRPALARSCATRCPTCSAPRRSTSATTSGSRPSRRRSPSDPSSRRVARGSACRTGSCSPATTRTGTSTRRRRRCRPTLDARAARGDPRGQRGGALPAPAGLPPDAERAPARRRPARGRVDRPGDRRRPARQRRLGGGHPAATSARAVAGVDRRDRLARAPLARRSTRRAPRRPRAPRGGRRTARIPASDLGLLREHVLDPLGRRARDPQLLLGRRTRIRHPDFAAALARAMNDWLIEEWLERDPRLRALDRRPVAQPGRRRAPRSTGSAGTRASCRCFLPLWSPVPYGNRIWQPLCEAIARTRPRRRHALRRLARRARRPPPAGRPGSSRSTPRESRMCSAAADEHDRRGRLPALPVAARLAAGGRLHLARPRSCGAWTRSGRACGARSRGSTGCPRRSCASTSASPSQPHRRRPARGLRAGRRVAGLRRPPDVRHRLPARARARRRATARRAARGGAPPSSWPSNARAHYKLGDG